MSGESCVTGGLINPDSFPVPDIHPGQLEYRAGRLRVNAADVSQVGSDIKSSWAPLSSCYSSPEAEILFAVVDPVATDGDSVATGADKAATALETFAEEVRGLQEQWATLTADANAFLASIEGDDDWRKGGWFGGESEKVGEHNDLLARIDPLRRSYEEAAIECANAINADLAVRTNFVHGGDGVEAGFREYVYGYDEDLSDFDMPWGGPADSDHRWYVDAAHSVSDFVVGGVEDLGGVFGAYSSEGWFAMDWGDALMEYHGDNLKTLGALGGVYDPETDTWGEVDWATYGNTWKEVAHAVVPWEEWDERPGYVIGTAALNIGSVVVGTALTATGVGAVVGVPLLAWRGSAILNKVDLDIPRDADAPATDGADVQLRLNLPYFGNVGPPLASFHLDPPALSDSLGPSEMADLQGALDRLEQANDEAVSGSDSPTNPTTQNLDDAMTVEDVLDPTSPEATRLREEYGGDFLENDVRGDGAPESWEATGGGSSGGDHDGADENLVPALVGPRVDTDESAGTPERSTNRSINLGGNNGSLDLADGDDGRVPVVNDSVSDDRSVDTPSQGSGTTHHGSDGGTPSDNGGSWTRPSVEDGPSGNTGQGTNGAPIGPRTDEGASSGDDSKESEEGWDVWNNDDLDDRYRPPEVPEENRTKIKPNDQGEPPYPRGNELFAPVGGLNPNWMYDLPGRGRFYTDDNGVVSYIDTHAGRKDARSPELRKPRPNVTYAVDVPEHKGKKYFYETDDHGRTSHVHGDLQRIVTDKEKDDGNKPLEENRSEEGDNENNEEKPKRRKTDIYRASDQVREGHRGNAAYSGNEEFHPTKWDGGHFIGTSFGGSGHRLNLYAQLRELNQQVKEGTPRTNFFALEDMWRAELKAGRHVEVDFEAVYPEPASEKALSAKDEVPRTIKVTYSIDGQPQPPIVYHNQPDTKVAGSVARSYAERVAAMTTGAAPLHGTDGHAAEASQSGLGPDAEASGPEQVPESGFQPEEAS